MLDVIENIAGQFRLGSWRESAAGRNELIRSVALHMIDNGLTDVSRAKAALRHRLGYREMGPEDQALFKQYTYYLKIIVTDWSLAGLVDQTAFRDGAIPPSTFASNIREARKHPLGDQNSAALA